jgi:hypothetical protein
MPEIAKPNRYGLPDAAHCTLVIDETVTIIAPGPNGRDHWHEATGTIIAVNSAILIEEFIDVHVWMVADGNAAVLDWFKKGYDRFIGWRIFSEAIHQRVTEDYAGDYTFWLNPDHFDSDADCLEFMQRPFEPYPDFFRPTETVTGIALDFAVRHGAKEINLIGVDMEGGYFDDPPGMVRDVINTYNRDCLQREIDYFKAQGIKFNALSPTRLEI